MLNDTQNEEGGGGPSMVIKRSQITPDKKSIVVVSGNSGNANAAHTRNLSSNQQTNTSSWVLNTKNKQQALTSRGVVVGATSHPGTYSLKPSSTISPLRPQQS